MQRYKKYDILHSIPKFKGKVRLCNISYKVKASDKSNIVTDVPDAEGQEQSLPD